MPLSPSKLKLLKSRKLAPKKVNVKRVDTTPSRANPEADKVRSTYRWRKLSSLIRQQFPLCMAPFCRQKKKGNWPASKSVHHILPLHSHKHLAFDRDNLCPVCDTCHAYVEHIERRGRPTQAMFEGWQDQDF